MKTNCVNWGKYKDKDGYGRGGYKGRVVRIHRAAYCEANGVELDDIKGLVVRHLCNNPSCINPEHLAIGTQLENAKDRELCGRTNHPTGIKNPSAKLSNEKVREIRARFKNGERKSHLAVGKEYGVSQSTISRIVRGELWGTVGDEGEVL